MIRAPTSSAVSTLVTEIFGPPWRELSNVARTWHRQVQHQRVERPGDIREYPCRELHPDDAVFRSRKRFGKIMDLEMLALPGGRERAADEFSALSRGPASR